MAPPFFLFLILRNILKIGDEMDGGNSHFDRAVDEG
jgi:hypothetical protein